MTHEGSFFASVDRPKSWYTFGKHEAASKKVDTLYRSYSERLTEEVTKSPTSPLSRLSRAHPSALSPRQAALSKVQKYVLGDGQCAVTVLPGASAVAVSSHLIHLLPYVACDDDYLICFSGQLSNLPDLKGTTHQPLVECHGHAGALTTGLLLGLYRQVHGDKNPEVLLAELQGHYAFFLYDGKAKQALAARDPTGEQPLFFCVDADTGAVAFTNSLETLPPEEAAGTAKWCEVPPGHYICSGPRAPALHQFALTLQQLHSRELQECTDIGTAIGDLEQREVLEKSRSLLSRLSRGRS